MISLVIFGLIFQLGAGGLLSPYLGQYKERQDATAQGDPGERLFLTPYINNGEIIRARELSRVTPFLGVESYSGFLTVDDKAEANMFFWFFPAENNAHDAPLALWLQGGPGAASIDAVFTENGPFVIAEDQQLRRRSYYWSQEINMIYIDNPVGTGFSFTNTYVTNETQVGQDLYNALNQFYQLFPEFRQNEFFITGESYAGKYIPAIAYTIHTENPNAFEKINLKGIAIGDGLVDPENMMKYGEYLYQHGLIDSQGLTQFNKVEAEVVSLIQKKMYTEAFREFDKLLNGFNLFKFGTVFYNTTGLNSYFNYATANLNIDQGGSQDAWLAVPEHRRGLHVGDQKFDESNKVETYLLNDIMQSVRPWLEVLMEHYKVLLYNGEFDIICAYPLTMNYVEKMNWSGKQEYQRAKRKLWYVDGELAGYAKTAGNFTEVLVRNAGHMVPSDQPLWALDLITKFTQNIPF